MMMRRLATEGLSKEPVGLDELLVHVFVQGSHFLQPVIGDGLPRRCFEDEFEAGEFAEFPGHMIGLVHPRHRPEHVDDTWVRLDERPAADAIGVEQVRACGEAGCGNPSLELPLPAQVPWVPCRA
jgi:hypothetical protein